VGFILATIMWAVLTRRKSIGIVRPKISFKGIGLPKLFARKRTITVFDFTGESGSVERKFRIKN
jgi:hypothetical protein